MGKFVKTDRFGNSYKTSGGNVNDRGVVKGYAEIGGKLYKLECYESKGDKYSHYFRVTQMKKRAEGTSF